MCRIERPRGFVVSVARHNTGAVFRNVFGAEQGALLAAAAMIVYAAVPVGFGLRMFRGTSG